MINKIKYMLFVLLCAFFSNFYVNASCTGDEIGKLKQEAAKIEITYKHMGAIETQDFIDYNVFKVNVKNINKDFYIIYAGGTEKIIPDENGEAVAEIKNGTWYFRIYSNKCEIEVSTIEVFLPRFNMYSLDPLCDGIDGEDFALCGKYYEYDVSYDNFKERVTNYRNTHVIVDDDSSNVSEVSIIDIILKYVNDYKFYIITFLCALLIIIIFVVVIGKRRKRSILE